MAVTPFISTADLYNPFRQSGDVGGQLYGKRRTDLGGAGALGPDTTSTAPVKQSGEVTGTFAAPANQTQFVANDGGQGDKDYLSTERQIGDTTGGVDRTTSPEAAEANPYDDFRDAIALDDFMAGDLGYDARGIVSREQGLGNALLGFFDQWTGGLAGLGINVATGINKEVQREDMHEYIAELQAANKQDQIEQIDTTRMGVIDYDSRQAGREGKFTGNVIDETINSIRETARDLFGSTSTKNKIVPLSPAGTPTKSTPALEKNRQDRDRDRGERRDHGGMSRSESDRRGGRQGGYGRSF